MQDATVYALIVIAVAPLIGIWRGHAWAKSHGLTLRKLSSTRSNQTA
jgi:hypothetical protein